MEQDLFLGLFIAFALMGLCRVLAYGLQWVLEKIFCKIFKKSLDKSNEM